MIIGQDMPSQMKELSYDKTGFDIFWLKDESLGWKVLFLFCK